MTLEALQGARLDLPDGGASEGWALIDEFAESLDSANGADRGAVFNVSAKAAASSAVR